MFNEPQNNVYFTLEVMVDVMDYQKDDPEIAVKMRSRDTNKIIGLWDYGKF